MKNLSLSINTPCPENWNNFQSAEGGRFCGSCRKVVVDFTKMSDEDMLEYLKSKTSKTCGRFRPDQLKTYQMTKSPAVVTPGLNLFRAGLAVALLLIVSRPGQAQSQPSKQNTEITNTGRVTTTSTEKNGHVIRGTVVDETKSAMPGVNVVLKGSTVGTVTDTDGKFEFPQKLAEGDVLVFSFIGLTTTEYVVRDRDFQVGRIEIPMVCMLMEIMGEVTTNEIYTENPSFIKRTWRSIKNLF